MIYIESTNHDPSYNLALEQYIFDALPRTESYFMLWQNDNTIVVGKFQNTAEEVNADYVREHNIHVVRRLSGGGAVYHDLGNLNFTFITDAAAEDGFNFRYFTQPVVNALAKVGIAAEFSSRNDLTIDGKKFSGNSQYIKQGRVMHHGTLLFHANLEMVSHALNVKPDKYESKGIKSVRSRVCNIADYLPQPITLEAFRALLLQEIFSDADVSAYALTGEDEHQVRKLQQEKYATWDWNYGFSPTYNVKKERKFPCGTLSLLLNVEGGTIQSLHIYGDFFGSGDTAAITQALQGVPLQPQALEAALANIPVGASISGLSTQELIDCLLS